MQAFMDGLPEKHIQNTARIHLKEKRKEIWPNTISTFFAQIRLRTFLVVVIKFSTAGMKMVGTNKGCVVSYGKPEMSV